MVVANILTGHWRFISHRLSPSPSCSHFISSGFPYHFYWFSVSKK